MKHFRNILEISNQSEVFYLKPSNILCITANGNYCDIHLADGEVLETVSFQRAEIARMIDEQLTHSEAAHFVLLGRSYLINVEHIQHINVPRQQLTFDVVLPSTGKKLGIHASSISLRNLREALDSSDDEASRPTAHATGRSLGGFTDFIAAPSRYAAMEEKDYEIDEDDVVFLG